MKYDLTVVKFIKLREKLFLYACLNYTNSTMNKSRLFSTTKYEMLHHFEISSFYGVTKN